MATLNLRNVILYDKWPGIVNPKQGRPTNGFDSTKEGSGNCVSIALFPIGEKIAVYNDGTYNPGWSTMAYLQFVEGSGSAYDAAAPSTGYGACFWYDETPNHPSGSVEQCWYVVTTDLSASDGSIGGAVAFPCCDLSGTLGSSALGDEFGWFWVGGVNPCVTSGPIDCTRLAGDMKTEGNVTAGAELAMIDDGTDVACLCAYCFTVLWETTVPPDITTAIPSPIGRALKADG